MSAFDSASPASSGPHGAEPTPAPSATRTALLILNPRAGFRDDGCFARAKAKHSATLAAANLDRAFDQRDARLSGG